jgi:hypothetical protein
MIRTSTNAIQKSFIVNYGTLYFNGAPENQGAVKEKLKVTHRSQFFTLPISWFT